jgi:Sec-independent protein translocase protein TatA
MMNLDPAKLLVIGVIALVVVGPERLPKYASQLGRAWRTLTTYRAQAEQEIRKVIPDLDLPHIPRSPSAAVSGYLTGLMTSSTTATGRGTTAVEDERGDEARSRTGDRSGVRPRTASRAAVSMTDLVIDDEAMN